MLQLQMRPYVLINSLNSFKLTLLLISSILLNSNGVANFLCGGLSTHSNTGLLVSTAAGTRFFA